MSYWSPLLDKHPHTPIEAYMGVFIDFRWKFLNLMAVKNLKYLNIFSNVFLIINQSKTYYPEL